MSSIVSPFVHYCFHSKLQMEDILALSLEIERLCTSNIPEILALEFSSEIGKMKKVAEYFIQVANVKQCHIHKDLAKTYSIISRRQIIGAIHIGAFLTSDCGKRHQHLFFKDGETNELKHNSLFSDEKYYETLTHLKQLILFSAFRNLYGETRRSVSNACDSFRLLTLGKKEPKNPKSDEYLNANSSNSYFIPIINTYESLFSIQSLFYSKFDRREDQSKFLGTFATNLKESLAVTPQYPEQEDYVLNTLPSSQENNIRTSNRLQHTQLIQRKSQQYNKITNYNINKKNSTQDITEKEPKNVTFLERIKQKDERPPYQQLLSAQEQRSAQHSRRRKLICDASGATEYAIQCFLKKISAYTDDEKNASVLLLLSLCLGKRLTLLKELQDSYQFLRLDKNKERYNATYFLELPAAEEKYGRHKDTYTIQLPSVFNQHIAILNDNSEYQYYLDVCKTILKEINSTYHVRLTIGNIGGFFERYLMNKGISKTFISLLTEPNPDHNIALYYSSIEYQKVIDVYHDFIRYLCNLQSNNTTDAKLPYPRKILDKLLTIQQQSDFNIGSKLSIPPDTVGRIFNAVSTAIKFMKKDRSFKTAQFHNTYTIYTLMIVTCFNGYRPVAEMLGYIGDYDLDTGLCFLADKDKGKKPEGRITYLGDIACQQLQQYISYCEFQYLNYQQTNRQLADYYQSIIDNNNPLIFFLSNEQEILKFTTTNLEKQFKILDIDLPPNWTRHYIRSLLCKNQFGDLVMNAWSGHDDDGEIPLGRFTKTSMQDLMAISRFINDHLKSLKVEALSANANS